MKRALVLAAIVVGFLFVAQAQADASALRLNDLGTAGIDVECVDQQAASALCPGGDANPLVGMITYVGSAGSWSANVTTSTTKPVIGSADFARLDLNDVSVSGGTGTLRIQATETDFTGPVSGGMARFAFNVGGTTNGTADFDAYLADANTAFGGVNGADNVGICGLPPFSAGAFSSSCVGAAAVTGTFSLTIRADITHTAAGQSTSFNSELIPKAPEPASILYGLGLGLVALAGSRKRLFVAA